MLRTHSIQDGPVNSDFEVRLNGELCQARECRVSAMPFNTIWPGHQRPLDQTELASYVSFESDAPVDCRITPDRAFRKATVRPLSKSVQVAVLNGAISFRLEKPGFYVLELDDSHKVLHIFFNAPKDFPEKTGATYYFGPGKHIANAINLKDNDSVYIDANAIVYGAIYGRGVKNVHIFGHGVIDGSSFERLGRATYMHLLHGNIAFYNSSDISVEGVILMNSPTWVARFFNCQNVNISNIKLVGQWRYNTDGIDLVNCQRCTVRHCFVRAFDDVLVVKGIKEYDSLPSSDLLFEDCVLWCDWGRTCEIGAETWASEFARIRFNDCDLIHNSCKALDIQACGPAKIHDITFENLRLEYQEYNLTEVYQCTESMKFTPIKGALTWLCIENRRWDYAAPYSAIGDITVKDISISLEDEAPMPEIMLLPYDGEDNPDAKFKQSEGFYSIYSQQPSVFGNITLQNIKVNDEAITDIERFKGLIYPNATSNLEIK